MTQTRWPRGTPVAPSGRGPGGGRFRSSGTDWASIVSGRVQRVLTTDDLQAGHTRRPPGPDWRDITYLLDNQKPLRSDPLRGGQSATSRTHVYADGSILVQKDYGRYPEEAVNEYLVSRVGEAINAPVAAVVQRGGTSYHAWVDGEVAQSGGGMREAARTRDGLYLALLDILVINGDRHGSNWLISGGRPIGIDHGGAHWISRSTLDEPPIGFLSYNPFIRQHPFWTVDYDWHGPAPRFVWIDNELTPNDVEWMRPRLEAIRPDFLSRDRGDAYDAMMARFEKIAAHARGTDGLG